MESGEDVGDKGISAGGGVLVLFCLVVVEGVCGPSLPALGDVEGPLAVEAEAFLDLPAGPGEGVPLAST